MIDRRPNILYIMTDQQSAEALGAAGNPHLSTPNLDRLAARGTRFDRAYCSFPLCVPSRVSMFSGRMPHEAGVFANVHESARPFPYPTLGALLRDAGYRNHYVGKWHLTIPEARRQTHGFEQIVYGGGYGDLDDKKADAAADFLAREHDRPFFLVVSFNNPHDCCELARGNNLRMGAIPPPPAPRDLPPLPANAAIPEGEPDVIRRWQRQHAERLYPSVHWTETRMREYIWGYYRLVEMVDREIGRVLDALDRGPAAANTAIVFASDHGDGHGRHWWNQKWSLYDEAARVPFIVCPPGGRAGGASTALVAAGLDLLPTVCDYAGVTAPPGIHGRSVRGLAEGHGELGRRRYVACETSFETWNALDDDRVPKARMIRGDRYKYCAFDSGTRREQLFDMQSDPGETVNLAADPAHADELARHRTWLADWCARTRDRFAIPGA